MKTKLEKSPLSIVLLRCELELYIRSMEDIAESLNEERNSNNYLYNNWIFDLVSFPQVVFLNKNLNRSVDNEERSSLIILKGTEQHPWEHLS